MTEYPQCVGCGYCCKQAKCILGYLHGGDANPCQFLIWSEARQRYVCELVIKDGPGRPISIGLGIGEGCTSNLNTWRKEVKDRG